MDEVGIYVGLGVGNEDGMELGDGLGISDGLLLGRSVGAAVSGHVMHVKLITAFDCSPSRPTGQYCQVSALKGGVIGHSLVPG